MAKQAILTSFLSQLAPDNSIKSVLNYPHPFTRGGFVVIFGDQREGWYEKLAHAHQARQNGAPKHQLHCLTANTLFELSQPGMFAPPLTINEFPHLPYFLVGKGSCLWGEDCRQLVKPYPQPDHLLAGHIEGCFDYLRRYGILMSLAGKNFVELGQILLNEMHYLMGTALLRANIWDVSLETVATQFAGAFPGHEASELLSKALLSQSAVNNQSHKEIHRIVFLFERLLRSFRNDLDYR